MGIYFLNYFKKQCVICVSISTFKILLNVTNKVFHCSGLHFKLVKLYFQYVAWDRNPIKYKNTLQKNLNNQTI